MTRGKKPPDTTALVRTGGPPDAAIVSGLRRAHALFKGKLETAVCTASGGQGEAGVAWEDPEAVTEGASYLLADAATYEIVGATRADRYFLKDGCRLVSGTRFLLVPMALA